VAICGIHCNNSDLTSTNTVRRPYFCAVVSLQYFRRRGNSSAGLALTRVCLWSVSLPSPAPNFLLSFSRQRLNTQHHRRRSLIRFIAITTHPLPSAVGYCYCLRAFCLSQWERTTSQTVSGCHLPRLPKHRPAHEVCHSQSQCL
jgi:hypothetical protein